MWYGSGMSTTPLGRSRAVAMLASGALLFGVFRQLGRSGLAITEAHYAGLAAALVRRTAAALGAVLGG